MASKVELVTVNTPLNSTSFQQQINSNFEAIEESLNKQLQREPQEGVNNAMQQELDMNSYRVINLAEPVNPADAARKQDVDDVTAKAQEYVDLAKDWATKTDGTVDGEEYSAKHYAQEARDVIESMSLEGCNDVNITSPDDGQSLIYDAASHKWVNGEADKTFKGVYDSAIQYHTGDIVQSNNNPSEFYQAVQDTQGNYINDTAYWSLISEDHLVKFLEVSNNINYPIGMTSNNISGSNYGGPIRFTNQNQPTINASTGTLNAPNLTTTTQGQNDNSTKAATTAYVDTAKDALQDQIDNLSARGRFLALWDCSTGLAMSDPSVSPYLYHSGDYFIVGAIASGGASNYRPTGSSYTIGVASAVVETGSVDIDDVYYYDGISWRLQTNVQKTVSFGNIAGDPYDNTNLANALNDKADSSSLAAVATSGSYSDLLDTPTVDQVYDSTSANAQSGAAINGAGFLRNLSTGSNSIDVNYAGTANNSVTMGANTTSASSAVTFGSSAKGNAYGVSIGRMAGSAGATGNNAISIGNNSNTSAAGSFGTAGTNSIAIGNFCGCTGNNAIAIGAGPTNTNCNASAESAIQLGYGINSTPSTFSVGFYNNGIPVNYKLLSADGTIPAARLTNVITGGQGAPTTSTVGTLGLLYRDLLNGPLYICTNVSGSTYTWAPVIHNSTRAQFSISIGGQPTTNQYATNCGVSSQANTSYGTAYGYGSRANGMLSTAVGASAYATAANAIQIGYGTNNTANTLSVGLTVANNYELLNSSGKVPTGRYIAMTGADGVNAGTIGAVPAPTATDNTKFLRGDGTWATAGSAASYDALTETITL